MFLSIESWVLLGIVFCALEVLAGMPIVFFIMGLSAFSVSAILYHPIVLLDNDVKTMGAFLFFSIVWGVGLWYPLKKLLPKKQAASAGGVIGQVAVVIDGDLTKGVPGNIKWSGTVLKAQIADDSEDASIPVNSQVIIKDIRDNIFNVVKKVS